MGQSMPTVKANIYSELYADELDQVATNLDQIHATEICTPNPGQIEQTTECRTRINANKEMVARAGIEPATFRFSGGRSYRLSYLAGRHCMPLRP